MAVKPLVLLLVLLLSQVAAESSCAEQGFTDGLACSSCEKLKDIVKDEVLYAECKVCCSEDETSDSKYVAGKLTVCRCKLPSHPHIQSFIDTQPEKFPHLKVALTTDGAYPFLTMKKEDGSKDRIAIERWKTEQVEEYLNTHLIAPSKS